MYSRFTFTACFVAVACAIALAGPGGPALPPSFAPLDPPGA